MEAGNIQKGGEGERARVVTRMQVAAESMREEEESNAREGKDCEQCGGERGGVGGGRKRGRES